MAGAAVDNLYIAISADSQKASRSIDDLCERLSKLQKGLGNIGSSSNANFTKLQTSAKKLNNAFNVAGTTTKSLTKTFGSMYLRIKALETAFKGLGKAVESSMNYVETSNFWQVSLNKIGEDFGDTFKQFGYSDAESYVNSFSERLKSLNRVMTGYSIGENGEAILTDNAGLGMDIEKLLNFQARIMGVTNSLGLMGETSVNTAKALSMLSTDLSSLTNTDLNTVMTNLQSGLVGQSRALYKYGIDITNATLQQYALSNGITKSVSAMSQSEKMQLRVLAILDQSKIAWGDQILTINSVANQFRVFQQQVSNLARTIGNLLLPVVQKVLPYLNAFAILANRVLTAIGGKLFGGNWLKNIQDGISGASFGGLEDLADDAENAGTSLGKAANNAKKLKNQLSNIDELNNLSTTSDSTAGGGISVGGGGSSFDLSGAIGDSLAEYESVWDAAIANSQNKAQELADKISGVFDSSFLAKLGLVTGIAAGVVVAFNKIKSVVELIGIAFGKTKIGETLALWTGGAGSLTESFSVVFGVSLPLVAGLTALAVGLGYVFDKNEQVRQGFSDAITTIRDGLQPAIDLMSNTVLPGFKAGWDGLLDILSPLGQFLEGMFTDIWMNGINPALTYIGETVLPKLTKTFENLWNKVLVPFGKFLGSVLSPVIELIAFGLENLWENVVEPLAQAVGGVLSEAFEGICDILNQTVIPRVGNVISTLTFLWNNVLVPVGSYLFNTFKPIFESVFESIGAVIDTAKGVFSGLINFVTGVFAGNWEQAWNGIKSVFSSVFTGIKNIVTNIFGGAWSTLKNIINSIISGVEKMANGIINGINGMIKALNKLSFKIPDWVPSLGGKSFGFNLKTIGTIYLPRVYATGGFPEDGWFRANHGEIMGRFDNGQSVVANNMQITDGIADAVYRGNRELFMIMAQEVNESKRQNELLLGILEKETGISPDDIFRSVRKSADEYTRRTGEPAFVY